MQKETRAVSARVGFSHRRLGPRALACGKSYDVAVSGYPRSGPRGCGAARLFLLGAAELLFRVLDAQVVGGSAAGMDNSLHQAHFVVDQAGAVLRQD